MIRERSIGSRSRQAGKAAAAAAMACRASSAPGIVLTAGTFVAATAWANCSRWAACEKSRNGSLIIGSAVAEPLDGRREVVASGGGRRRWWDDAWSLATRADVRAVPSPALTSALSRRESGRAACGEASSTSSETSSEKPARSHDWFDVFSSSRRTK